MRSRVFPLSLALAVGACGIDVSDDYAVSTSWLINGIPPSAAQCADFGVDRVRLRIKSHSHDRSLEAPCESTLTLSDGFDYGGFDTTFSFAYDTSYTFEVAMLDAAGNVVQLRGNDLAYTGTFRVRDRGVSYYELQPLELFSPFGNLADVEGAFSIAGKAPTAQSCDAEGISKVYLDLASATDPDFVDYEPLGEAACEDGVIYSNTPPLAEGEYFMRYVAVDANGDTVSIRVPVSDGSNYEVYAVDRAGTLSVQGVDLP
jgi:hypothetical protein